MTYKEHACNKKNIRMVDFSTSVNNFDHKLQVILLNKGVQVSLLSVVWF